MEAQNTLFCYAALFLTPSSQTALLQAFPPFHPIVHADHVTLIFCPTDETIGTLPLGTCVTIQVISEAQDQYGHAVLVQIADSRPEVQTMNKYPHITISIAEGVSPVYSNTLLANTEICRDVENPLLLDTVLGLHFDDTIPRVFSQEALLSIKSTLQTS